jgi:DNA-binding NarL/FixJ family response regulator
MCSDFINTTAAIYGLNWPGAEGVQLLNDRQKIVCALIARGLTNTEIAIRLDAGLRTIELLRKEAADALGIESRMLIIWSAQNVTSLPCDFPATLRQNGSLTAMSN